MAKLYFRYGVMGSSKTANALMVRYNYEEKGKYAWLIKPALDTRDDIVGADGRRTTIVKSRIGLSANATVIGDNEDILDVFHTMCKQMGYDPNCKPDNGLTIDAIVADESQFFSERNIDSLKYICEHYHIPIICYGLLTDFQMRLFPGSKRLVEVAHELEKIRHICSCGEGAQVNARIDPMGNVVSEGAQVEIGGNERYEAMCWRCWRAKINNQTELEI
jgi:thymidine kinase